MSCVVSVLITSRVSRWGNIIGPICLWVCVSVCHLASALMAKQIDLQTWKLAQGLGLITSDMSLMVNVIGQGHQVKNVIFSCWALAFYLFSWYKTLAYGVTSWSHMPSRNDVTSSLGQNDNVSQAKRLKTTWHRRCVNTGAFSFLNTMTLIELHMCAMEII